ncbi:MAG: hypothetical protein II916_03855, partial [Oscillospiraceae bacterium]|nr:hypothetical protein [Oscillospiraceae bacterium]
SSIRMITPVIPAETLAKTSTQQTTAPTATVLTKTAPVSTDPTDPTEVYPVTDQESESITTTDDENVSESLDPTETDVTPEPTVPVSEPPKLPGFVWELLSNAEYPVWGIRVQPDAAEADCPTNFSIDYQTDRKRYRIRGVQTDWKYRIYDVSDTETGINFEIRQFIRRDFEFRWDNDGSQQISTLGDLGNGIHGFFMYDPMHQQFAMCWDDGNYVMTVQSQEPDILDDALPLAFHAVKI